jgi:hypothetical protein
MLNVKTIELIVFTHEFIQVDNDKYHFAHVCMHAYILN